MTNAQGLGVEIIVNGSPLREIAHNGKCYVAAPHNQDYAIRVHVPRGGRYEGIISVDGLDVLTGKTASALNKGYIMTAADFLGDNDLLGFRLNKNEVAKFRFGAPGDSYAAQLDKPDNIGVIAIVVYAEQHFETPVCRGGATRGGVTRGGTRGHDTGTEFGDRTEQRVETTKIPFQRGPEVARFVIEYASADSLRQAGILVDPPLGAVNPFPADTGCTPPKNWHGNR